MRFGDDQIIAQNAASVTTKLQQMASGFVYNPTLARRPSGLAAISSTGWKNCWRRTNGQHHRRVYVSGRVG